MMSSKSSRFVDFMIFCLIVIYIGSYFMPKHYGVRCDGDSPPLGTMVLVTFYIVWTFFTCKMIRDDPTLKIKE